METVTEVGRNEPCPCGSGQKFKKCCETKLANRRRNNVPLLAAAALLIAGGVAVVLFRDASAEPVSGALPRAIGTAAAPGPGNAPPGKVWSTEHKHWHDAPSAAAPPITITPQPGSPAPPPTAAAGGRVWSQEHGHWHDAAGKSQPAASPVRIDPVRAPGGAAPAVAGQPATPAPPGKVWSAEHKHWHDLPTEKAPVSNVRVFPQGGLPKYPAPEGPAPEGKVWSAEHGHWHDKNAPNS